ncbi:MAG: ABC transporter [Nitrospirales bacterium]|nr:MAG: ABC transporter [Nitrospirales bacterium]
MKFISALIVLATFSFGGCLGSPAPQDHFYRLELPPPESSFSSPRLYGTIQITRPLADALTSERHLLYRTMTGTAQVHRHAYHRWIDSPTLILQQQITQYLRHSGIATHVVTPELRIKADYRFSCRITRLERILDESPRVIMELELGLTRLREREAVLLQTYRVEQPANGPNISAAIEAYNHALSKILDQFLEDTSTLPEALRLTQSP